MIRHLLLVCAVLQLWLAPSLPVRWYLPLTMFAPAPGQGHGPPAAKSGVGGTGCADIQRLGADWYQSWGPRAEDCGPDSHFLAMVWDYHGGPLPEVSAHAYAIQMANEPNLPWQANMTVAESIAQQAAAEAKWPHRRLVSLATAGDLEYLGEVHDGFHAAYGRPPRWDYIAVHCYWPTADACINYIRQHIDLAARWYPAGPPQIIVSEWSFLPCDWQYGAGDMTRAKAEAEKLRTWMEAQPQIAAHLWFATRIEEGAWWAFPEGCNTPLIDGNGLLTEWGNWFIAGQ